MPNKFNNIFPCVFKDTLYTNFYMIIDAFCLLLVEFLFYTYLILMNRHFKADVYLGFFYLNKQTNKQTKHNKNYGQVNYLVQVGFPHLRVP